MQLTKDDNVVILSHFYKRAGAAGGPPQEMRDYLVPKVRSVVYIEHPFPYADDHRSSMTIYEQGRLEETLYTVSLKGPEIFFYLADIFITWYFLFKAHRNYQICIALDNLNTLSVLPARWLGWIKNLIFYTIDYSPRRFAARTINRIYQFADRLACCKADAIWILSERMTATRVEHGLDLGKSAPAIILPMGANLGRIKLLPDHKINRHQLIFVGHLLQKQGLQLVVKALSDVVKKVPDVKLVVIGQGEYTTILQQLARQEAVDHLIDWQGFVAKHEDVEKIICACAIGLAPYLPSEDNYTYYTDPGKPKLYIGCGLPVIITDFPASAKLIAREKAGIIVKPTIASVKKSLIELLTNDQKYFEFRHNAIKLSKEFDTTTLINRAIEQTNEPKS